MPVVNWNQTVIDGVNYIVISLAQLMIPLDWDPSSNVLIAVAAPVGGTLDYPALVKGDKGDRPVLDLPISYTLLAATDTTPDSASWTDLGGGLYHLNLVMHRGMDGSSAANVMHTATDLTGTAVAGKIIVLNSTLDGFVYASEKVGDSYIPATGGVFDTASGNPSFTIATIGVPPMPWDWRPQVSGYTIVTGTGPAVITDLVARLNGTGGNEIGRCPGFTATERLILTSGPPAGSPDAWDRVLANAAATLYLRAERQSGTDTFTTSKTTTRFRVKVNPVP